MPRLFMPIASAFAPNYTFRDVLIAAKFIAPWNWRNLAEGSNIRKLEEEFSDYMDAGKAVSFDSGRSGLYAILMAMGVHKDDEVLLQAFTTVALPNTIKLFGAKPVFVDIETDTYNIDPNKIEGKITPKTKAIIIQHTFGNPAAIDQIMEIAQRHNLMTIEDCAHSLGARYKGEKTGRFADAAFFSFGRDKIISSVSGGMVIAREPELIDRIKSIRDSMPLQDRKRIKRMLLHPIITFTALHTYNLFYIGKLMMFMAYKFSLLDKAYMPEEKNSEVRRDFARKMPNALAAMALHQMKLLNEFNRHRLRVSQRYAKNINNPAIGQPLTLPIARNTYLWYTITVKDKARFIKKAAKRGMIFGDWFPQAIGPAEVDLKKAGYEPGSCPIAERISATCVNLPTHHDIHRKETEKIVQFINDFK